MPNNPLDTDLSEAMQSLFEILKEHPGNRDTDDQLRRRIVSSNLKALAEVLLMADSNPDLALDLKKVVLGILGTSDWLAKDLPDIDGYFERNISFGP